MMSFPQQTSATAGFKRKRDADAGGPFNDYGADFTSNIHSSQFLTRGERSASRPCLPLPLEHPQWHDHTRSPNNYDALELEDQTDCTSLPHCSNPECEDVQPCSATLAPCIDPELCYGSICYDETCDAQDVCQEHCETTTRCATPCYSPECSAPACEDTCTSTHHSQAVQEGIRHFQVGQEAICQSSTCSIPGTQCIDPRCLSGEYVPAAHKHHGLEDFYSFSGLPWNTTPHQHDIDNQKHVYSGHSVCNPYDQPQQNTNFYQNGFDQAFAYTQSLQPLLDWNLLNPKTSNLSGLSLDTASNVPSLSHSLTATPSTTASRRLTSAGSITPSISTPAQGNVCLWTYPREPGVQSCGMIFNTPAELHEHVEREHIQPLAKDQSVARSNSFQCYWLGCTRHPSSDEPAAFAARPKLKRHAHTHTMHKPFACKTCGMSMKTKDALEKHERTHTGERPYACSVEGCHKIFATSTELKTHMVVHSGRKPHICELCGEGFADSSNLSKHRKTHLAPMYRCPEDGCGARMKRWDQMRRHMATQGHGGAILDDLEAQRQYKIRMEHEWKELPDGGKLLSYKRLCS